ncbi:MAG TPA: hypothetical protein VLV87_01270 [Gammaproteobacteria bacterium]|nr:hypothetical protein [Gammaproteobacteria bacterium]
MRLTRLHASGAALDVAALALLFMEILLWVPASQADRDVLVLVGCVVPISFAVFLLVPRRAGLLRETAVPARSLMVYATLGAPIVVGLLTLLLVGMSRSFDSFAGFALVLAADAGRNLCEWLRNRH